MDDEMMDEGVEKAPPMTKGPPGKGKGMPPEMGEMKAKADSLHRETVAKVGAAPPASSPLSADRVMRLAEALEDAVEELGNGEVEGLGMPELGEGPVRQLPPEVFAGLKAVRSALDEIGGKAAGAYDFDPEEAASSDQGLEVAISQLTKMKGDQRLLMQMQGAKPQAEKAEKKAPPKEPEPKKEPGYGDLVEDDEEM